MAKNANTPTPVFNTRETFNLVTFKTPEGKERSLRADFFWQATQQSEGRSTVYYERKRDSGYFTVAHNVDEVNRMVREALYAGM